MILKKAFLFFIFCFLIANNQLIAQNWKLEKATDGIQVFTRMVEGSAIKEYKAITMIKTTIGDLNQLMKNHEELKTWFVRCLESTRLKKISEDEYYVYLLNNAPWPVQDRDNIVHIKFELKKDGTQWIYLKGIPDYIPKKSNCVRIPKMAAHWEFQPLANGMIKVTQQVLADLGGKIPAWLINVAIVDAPFETLSNLRGKLMKE